ncbi:MFS general substrate transporter [Mycena leptocephala]|nr:MFS general substrate transporter [Mycena leptocephala]
MITNVASSAAVSIFLPYGADLNIPEAQLQWVVSSASLSSVGLLLLLLGRLADLFGRKKFFVLGTVWLGVFSIGCGFAQNSTSLYVLRGLQGIGPAAFIPACVGILAHGFPPSRARSIAFATFSAGAPVGGALGTQLVRSSLNTRGMAALCALGGLFVIDADTPSTEVDKRVDWLGAGLVTSALVLLLFVLGQCQLAPHGWRTPYIIALLVLDVLLLVLLIFEGERGGRDRPCPPLMKLSLWTRAEGKFAAMQAIALLQWAAFLLWYFWVQVYYEDYVHLRPVLTAVRMLPMTVAGFLCNVFVVLVIGRIDLAHLLHCPGRPPLRAHPPRAAYWAYGFPSPIVSVFGADFTFAAGTLFLAKIALPHEQSLAGGLFQTLMQLGTAFGWPSQQSCTTPLRRARAAGYSRGRGRSPAEAYQAAQWTAFGMAMLCTLLAVGFLRGVGPVGVDERQRDRQEQEIRGEEKEKRERSSKYDRDHGRASLQVKWVFSHV